jgi:hypothetical protein
VNYEIIVVPPGGGEADYVEEIKGAPSIPRPGDYLLLSGEDGLVRAFKARYTVHVSRRSEGVTTHEATALEVEPVSHAVQSEAHAKMVSVFQSQGFTIEDFPESGF